MLLLLWIVDDCDLTSGSSAHTGIAGMEMGIGHGGNSQEGIPSLI